MRKTEFFVQFQGDHGQIRQNSYKNFIESKKIANISKNILFFPNLILNIMNLVNETGNDSKKMYKMNKKYEGTFQQVFHS